MSEKKKIKDYIKRYKEQIIKEKADLKYYRERLKEERKKPEYLQYGITLHKNSIEHHKRVIEQLEGFLKVEQEKVVKIEEEIVDE
ncbi:MAG: hypothetical protein ACXAB2_06740 [Candidatus Hodarchaeales archaeon]|jgi:hypothetical protein